MPHTNYNMSTFSMSLPYRKQVHYFLIQINGVISVQKVR